jgi:hypothetical protein
VVVVVGWWGGGGGGGLTSLKLDGGTEIHSGWAELSSVIGRS